MKDYPVIKISILFVSGIFSAQLFTLDFYSIIAVFVLLLFLFILKKKIVGIHLYSFLIFLIVGVLIISIGNYLAKENKIKYDPYLSGLDKLKNTTVIGEISRIDLIRNNELLFYVEIDSMFSDDLFVKNKLNILCKARLEHSAAIRLYHELQPGNKIEVIGFYYRGKQKRNPGEFDYDAYLRSKEVLGILAVTEDTSIVVFSHSFNVYRNIIHQVRKTIDEQIKKYHSVETTALLRGLLLADRREINYQTKTHFINAGVVHVLAVSGLHVGYIILIFLFLFGRLNLFVRSILTIVGLICFMLITGVPPSVFRATVMAVVLIFAFLSNRTTNLINSISIAAIIILVIDPNEIYNPGFQLSFAAVMAIGILFPYMSQIIDRWDIKNKILKYVLLFCGVSLSAQIGTLPFTLLYFNKLSIIALCTNFIVIPAIGIIIAAAVVTLIFSAFLPFVAVYFGAANDLISGVVLQIIKFSGTLNFSHIIINGYSIVDLTIFYLMLTILIFCLTKFTNLRSKLIVFFLISANIFILSSIDDVQLLPENYLSVLMIDVGQGDSFLIKFPNGKTALVDAGNTTSTYDNGERVIIPLLNYFGIKKIDYGIVTHIDADHYGGFVALILGNRIGEVFKPEIDSSLSKDKRFEEFIKDRGLCINYFKEKKMEIGNAILYFLYDNEIENLASESTNDKSGIFKLVYGETSFLFTGDVEKGVEKIYAKKYKDFLDSDVLKVGHHGSKTSTSELFINYISPQLSLISAGFKNKFGHPVQDVINRLNIAGSTIYRTDLDKAILLRSDGKEINRIIW